MSNRSVNIPNIPAPRFDRATLEALQLYRIALLAERHARRRASGRPAERAGDGQAGRRGHDRASQSSSRWARRAAAAGP